MKIQSFSRTVSIVGAVVLSLATLVVLSKTFALWSAHEGAISRAERDTASAAGILAEHTARTFEGVSRALAATKELRDEVEAGLVNGAEATHEALRTIHGGSPVILGIGWTDAAGDRVASSIARDPPALNIAEQDHFRAQRDDDKAGLYIGAPVRSKLDGSWIIAVSRRVEDRAGNFAGIVNAALRLDYFLDFYRAINLGPDTGVALARSDGVVLAHAPTVENWMDQPLAGVRTTKSAPTHTRQSASPVDGVERIFAVERLADLPLMIVAAMSRADALAAYQELRLAALGEGALIIIALVAGGALLVAAARELSGTSALLQSVFVATDQAIVIFDQDLKAVAWNLRYEQFFGPAQVGALTRGASFESMLRAMAAVGEHGSGDGEAFVAERLARARSRQPVRYERARPDGTVIDINWQPLPNGYLAIAHTDTTHIKKAETALRESEARAAQAHARLSDAVESLADPFFLWDAEERLVLANRAAASGPGGEALVPGIRLEDAIAHHVLSGRFPAALGREHEYIRERVRQIRAATGEVAEVERADGTWLATWDRRTREGGIVSLRVDITALKQSEFALRESEAKLAQAHARLSDAIESLDDVFMLWDAQDRLVLFNKAASRVFSTREQALAVGVSFETSLRQVVASGRVPDAIGQEEEFIRERLAQFRRGDGDAVELRVTNDRWLAASDRRTRDGGIVSLRIDITEIKQRESELSEARKAADTANRAKSEFLSRMSHELRTPLNAVIGFSQMMQLEIRDPLTERQRIYCRDIETGGRHLLALVDDVLDLARIESGKERMSIERVAVADALSSLRVAMSAIADSAGIDLVVAEPLDIPDLRADDMRLHQILLNLVSNAIKYNRENGSVGIVAERVGGGRVRIVVADTGIGISDTHQAELFEPFHRLGQEHSGIDGTGIGLAICKRLAEAMDGSIGFTSATGRGSTFWVELPTYAARTPAVAPPVPAEAAAETWAAAPSGFSLLYVEDNPSNMRLMEHLVSALPNVTLLQASTPHLGLDLARAHRPDLILLDLHLPGMSGFEMLAHLKAMDGTREIPVVALTAAAMPSDIRRGFAAGFRRYLTKPIDVKEFLTAISECIPLDDGDDTQEHAAD